MNGGTMIHHDSPIPWDDDEQGIFLNVCFMQLSHINGISYINISYDMYIYTYVHIQWLYIIILLYIILSKYANNVFYGQWNTARVVTLDWILMLTVTLSIQFGVSVGILDLQIPKRSKKWIEKSFTRNTFSITYFIYLYYIYYSFHLAIPRARTNAANAGSFSLSDNAGAQGETQGGDHIGPVQPVLGRGRSDVTCCGQ
jgi:hypothetical protein